MEMNNEAKQKTKSSPHILSMICVNFFLHDSITECEEEDKSLAFQSMFRQEQFMQLLPSFEWINREKKYALPRKEI